MKEPIAIKDILAIVFKRGKFVLGVAFICALLGGVFQYQAQIKESQKIEYSQDVIEAVYQAALQDYEKNRNVLEEDLKIKEALLRKQEEYNDNSVLMQLDPYNKYRCHILLQIIDIEDAAFGNIYEDEGTPIDYVITKIQNLYDLCWSSMPLTDAVEEKLHQSIDNKYLREIVTVSRSNSGTLRLTTYGRTAEEAEILADIVVQYFKEIKPAIEEGSYAHNLSTLLSISDVSIDHDLEQMQSENIRKEKEYSELFADAQKALNKLKKPERGTGFSEENMKKAIGTWTILGAIVGMVLASMFVWIAYIMRDSVENSYQVEVITKVPFLGNVAKNSGWFTYIANCFIGERQWKNMEAATHYFYESVKHRLPNKTDILVISSLEISEESVGVQSILNELKKLGHNTCYVYKGDTNPESVSAICNCSYVIMVESPGKSNQTSIHLMCDLVKQFEKEIIGFVFV